MPSKSGKQHRLMEMIAHGGHARGKGPSMSVAKDFVAADRGRKFTAPKAAKLGKARGR